MVQSVTPYNYQLNCKFKDCLKLTSGLGGPEVGRDMRGPGNSPGKVICHMFLAARPYNQVSNCEHSKTFFSSDWLRNSAGRKKQKIIPIGGPREDYTCGVPRWGLHMYAAARRFPHSSKVSDDVSREGFPAVAPLRAA